MVEHRDAVEVMAAHDSPATLHYVDPPYMAGTRSAKRKDGERYHVYVHELSDADHARLLEFLAGVEGMVALSGYPSALYDAALGDWLRLERPALADGARARLEVLWLNPAAVAARYPLLF